MESSAKLQRFVQAFGDVMKQPKSFYFIALRFKRPFVIMKSVPKKWPTNSLIVVHGTGESHQELLEDSLILFAKSEDINKGNLLLKLFPDDTVLHHAFSYETLFVVSTCNPFIEFWHKTKNENAFTALKKLAIDQLILKAHYLLFDHITNFRFFNPKKRDLQNFSSWLPLSQSLFMALMNYKKVYFPIPEIGSIAHKIAIRSKNLQLGPLPPKQFYTCEIMFNKPELLGIICNLDSKHNLKYISPMIISLPKMQLKDVNGVNCNMWLPLFQDKNTWLSSGIRFYLQDYHQCLDMVKSVLSWLPLKNYCEKYKFIYMDYIHIGKIMLGEDVDLYLKEEIPVREVQPAKKRKMNEFLKTKN